MYKARRALNWPKVWGDTKNKRSAITCIKSQSRASAKLLWRTVEASKCRCSEMKAAVGGPVSFEDGRIVDVEEPSVGEVDEYKVSPSLSGDG